MSEESKQIDQEITTLVGKYATEYGRKACLSSIVRSWLRTNNVSEYIVRHCTNIQSAIALAPARDLETRIISSAGKLSLKQAEVSFESLIDSERKRREGIVYTPNYVIDYIIRRCNEMRNVTSTPNIIDPACGSGGFIVRAIPIISEWYDIHKEKVINEHIYGVDINSDAIEYAKLMIELFCAENSINAPSNFEFLLREDSLLTPKERLLTAFGINDDAFDIVLTNPPYVKLQNLDQNYRQRLYEAYPEFTIGSFSLAMLFLVAGYRLLSSSGALGYITQNNIYTSLAGEKVREFLQQHRSIHTIVDFGHKKIFPTVSAYTCLIFLDKVPQERMRFRRCYEPDVELPALRSSDFHDIQIKLLSKKKWRLAAPHHLRNLQHLESNGTPLGNLANIRVGFATLRDRVFLIDGNSRLLDIEPDITTPAIKVADFSSEEELRHNRARVIQPYQKIKNKWIPIEEKTFQQLYPNAYAHLKAHQAELSKRDKGRGNQRRFYEWGRSQCMEASGPKLLTKTFNRGPNFLLDETDSLFCNGYSVKPRADYSLFAPRIDIKILQKILNSWVMDYYTRLTSFQIEGGYQCFQKNFIERFCIPNMPHDCADNILNLNGIALQKYVCDFFGLSIDEILEVVPY